MSATNDVHHGWFTPPRGQTSLSMPRCGSPAEDAAFAQAWATLSKREQQLLRLRAQGLTIVEVCEHYFLCDSTVRTHLHSAFRKLGLGHLRDHARCSRACYLLGRYDANATQTAS